MAIVMIVTMFPVIPTGKDASAAVVNDYTVYLKFFEFDEKTSHVANIPNSGNLWTGQNYHVIATLYDKGTKNVAGYGFVVVDNINQSTWPIELHITKFWSVSEKPYSYNSSTWPYQLITVTQSNWVELPGGYDPDKYDVSLRLRYGDTPSYYGPDNHTVVGYGPGYSTLNSQVDSIDGYNFLSSIAGASSGEINLYRGEQMYEMAMHFDPDMPAIKEDEGYFILVEATHSSGNKSYYYKKLSTDGSNPYVIRVKNGSTEEDGEWLDGNGNIKKTEKFSTRWSPVTVSFIKAEPGMTPNLNNALSNTNCARVTNINGYDVTSGEKEVTRDEEGQVVYHLQNINLKKISTSRDYTLEEILGDSINYGITSATMEQVGHSETNLAVKSFKGNGNNIEPDLSTDGYPSKEPDNRIPGSFLIGAIEDEMQIGNLPPVPMIAMVGTESKDKLKDITPGRVVTPVLMDKDEIDSAVDGMIDRMKSISSDLAKQPATLTPQVIGGVAYIDATHLDEKATIYIDADSYLTQIATDSGVKIKLKGDQLIVFNFTKKRAKNEEIVIKKTMVSIDGSEYYDTDTKGSGDYTNEQNVKADLAAQHLIWNLNGVKKSSSHSAGGVFLNPNDDSEMGAGGTTCGWIINAGKSLLGKDGEFHFVYHKLRNKPLDTVYLRAYKKVDGEAAAKDQVFEFKVAWYNQSIGETGEFETLQEDILDSDNKVIGKRDLIIRNTKDRISLEAPFIENGKNIYRITEFGQDENTSGAYSKDTRAIYAMFTSKVESVAGADVRILSGVSYFRKFEGGVLSEKITPANAVFENKTLGGTFSVTKNVTGDLAPADTEFTVVLSTTNAAVNGDYTAKRTGSTTDETVTFASGKATFKIKANETVTIEDLPENAEITVSENNLPAHYTLITAAADLTAKVALTGAQAKVTLTNKYTAPKGKLTVTKKIAGDAPTTMPTFKVSVYNSDTKKYYDKNGKDYDTVQWEAIVPNTPIEFKDLPVGDNYVVAEDESSAKDVNGGFIFVSSSISNNGKVIEGDDPYFTIKSTEDTIITGLPVGTYTVTEKDASVQGFTLTGTFTGTATISKAAKNATVKLVNNYKKIVKISKTDLGGTAVSGATIVLKDSDKKQIESWTSGETAKTFELGAGTYYFQETVAPTGYEKVDTEIEFTVDNSGNVTVVTSSTSVEKKADGTIVLKDAPKKYPVSISKTDLGGTALEGATIELWKKGETEKTTWTSEKTAKTLSLEAGTYLFKETAAPQGYKKVDTEIEFTVANDGKVNVVTVSGSVELKDGVIILKDAPKKYPVSISKTDLGGTAVSGATIVLKDSGKTQIESWTSGETAKTFELEAGTYYFQETVAPVGYEKVDTEIEFTVDNSGNVTVVTSSTNVEKKADGTIVLKDAPKKYSVSISKTDLGGTAVSGATIVLKDSGKTQIESWTSGATAKTFELEAGTYYFQETAAPTGYQKVDTEIKFTVAKDGTVSVEEIAGVVEKKADGTIVLKDAPEAAPTKYPVSISKTDLNGTELEGAKIEVKKGDDVIASWTSTNEKKTINLEAGKYTFKETAAPTGYEKVETAIEFTVGDEGTVTVNKVEGVVDQKADGTIVLMDKPKKYPV
ncbi:MAG: hypothetical protein IKN79_06880, partial [Eubacterium sp.]|nr:hypothetical protein [Eubacterium sp.]